MTAITALTGKNAKVTINGRLVALSDAKFTVKGGTVTQPRMGESTPRVLQGMKEFSFTLTNLDLDGDMLALAMADAVPTTQRQVLENCDVSGAVWVSSNPSESPIVAETTLQYEGAGCLKVVNSADPSGNTITGTISSKDISSAHVIEHWVRSSVAGNVCTFGFGESAITENTQEVTIQKVNQWERQVLFISDISSAARNAVTQIGYTLKTLLGTGTIYFDNINSLKGFKFGAGVYFTLTAQCKHPTDDTQYVDVFVPNAFLTSGDISFGDVTKVIDGPMSGSVLDASEVVITYSQ